MQFFSFFHSGENENIVSSSVGKKQKKFASVSEPDSLNSDPDPGFLLNPDSGSRLLLNPDPDKDFYDKSEKKIYNWKFL